MKKGQKFILKARKVWGCLLFLPFFLIVSSCSKENINPGTVKIKVINESLYNQSGVYVYTAGIYLQSTDQDPFVSFDDKRDISKGGETTFETSGLIPGFYYFKADVSSYFIDPAKPFYVDEKGDVELEIKL